MEAGSSLSTAYRHMHAGSASDSDDGRNVAVQFRPGACKAVHSERRAALVVQTEWPPSCQAASSAGHTHGPSIQQPSSGALRIERSASIYERHQETRRRATAEWSISSLLNADSSFVSVFFWPRTARNPSRHGARLKKLPAAVQPQSDDVRSPYRHLLRTYAVLCNTENAVCITPGYSVKVQSSSATVPAWLRWESSLVAIVHSFIRAVLQYSPPLSI